MRNYSTLSLADLGVYGAPMSMSNLQPQPQSGLSLEKLGQTWPVKAARGLLDAVQLPGQVAGGILGQQPSQPGMWSDMDEAKAQANQQTMRERATDLAGLLIGGSYGAAPAGSVGSSGARMTRLLPMDEASRMARAAEQGYTIDAYKGMMPYHPDSYPTTNGFGKVLEPPKLPKEELTVINSNRGGDDAIATGAGFFSNKPEVASRFAKLFQDGSVFPVKLKFENPKVIDAKGAYAADFQFGPGAGRLRLDKDSPHDGVILKNTRDEGDVYIPRTPEQIRSRFAAFDPANAGKAGLLGGLAALLMSPEHPQVP